MARPVSRDFFDLTFGCSCLEFGRSDSVFSAGAGTVCSSVYLSLCPFVCSSSFLFYFFNFIWMDFAMFFHNTTSTHFQTDFLRKKQISHSTQIASAHIAVNQPSAGGVRVHHSLNSSNLLEKTISFVKSNCRKTAMQIGIHQSLIISKPIASLKLNSQLKPPFANNSSNLLIKRLLFYLCKNFRNFELFSLQSSSSSYYKLFELWAYFY